VQGYYSLAKIVDGDIIAADLNGQTDI